MKYLNCYNLIFKRENLSNMMRNEAPESCSAVRLLQTSPHTRRKRTSLGALVTSASSSFPVCPNVL